MYPNARFLMRFRPEQSSSVIHVCKPRPCRRTETGVLCFLWDITPDMTPFEAADTGMVADDGKLIEKPVLREMHRIVAIAERMGM